MITTKARKRKARKIVSRRAAEQRRERLDRINRIYRIEILAQNAHKGEEAVNPSELAFTASSPLCAVLRTQPFAMAVLSLERFLIAPLNVFTLRSRSVFSFSSRLANRSGAAARVQSNILLGISGRA